MTNPPLTEAFPWSRFWLPRDVGAILEDDAFLADPQGPLGPVANPAARPLDAVDARLAVLLGEPGAGKSRTVQDYAATTTGVEVIALPDAVSAEELRESVDAALTSHPGPLVIVFDGLDEAMIRFGSSAKWLPAALRRRSAEDLERLRVRVTCRPAVWPETLADELARPWPGVTAEILSLGPLRRSDVLLAAARLGVDGDEFLSELVRHDLLPFAARPLTLRPLLADVAEGNVPHGKVAVYRSLCERLSHELNPGVHDAVLVSPPAGPSALDVAGRLAAMSLFTGRPVLWRAADPRERGPQELDVDDALSQAGGIDRSALRRALNTGLFDSAGPHRFRFAHRTYGEFLAAAHADQRGVTTDDLLGLVLDQDGRRVQPQLGEVAAWLAALRPDVFDALTERDPELLLTSDVAIRDDEDRARLAEALLARQDQEPAPPLDRSMLRRLASSAVVPRLTAVLTEPGHTFAARYAALDIATAVPGMDSTIVDLAADASADGALRAVAARRLTRPLTAAQLARLRLVLDEPGLDDDLRGTLLGLLWPAELGIDEVLAAASATPISVGGASVNSAYTHFLTRALPHRVPGTDLPRALDWASGHAATSQTHGDAADALLARALTELTETTVAAVARVWAARLRAHGAHRRDVEAALAGAAADRDRRRLLLRTAIEQAAARGGSARTHLLLAVRIGHPEDFSWAIAEAGNPSLGPSETQAWADVADRLFRPLEHPDHLDALFAAADADVVSSRFSTVLGGMRVDGPEATQARELFAAEQDWAAEEAGWEQADRPDRDVVRGALALDRDDAWMALMAALDPHLSGGAEFDVEVLTAWQQLTPDQQATATALARRWLEHSDPTPPSSSGSWPASVIYELRALWLFAEDTTVHDEMTDEQWAAWSHVLLGIAAAGENDSQRRAALLAVAYDRTPDPVCAAVQHALDREAARRQAERTKTAEHGEPDPLQPVTGLLTHLLVEHLWDERLGDALLAWQRARTDDLGLVDVVPRLVRHGHPEAVSLARDALSDSGTDLTATRRRIAGAVALLRCPDAAAYWPAIWQRWQADPSLGEAVVGLLERSAGWGLPAELAGLDENALAELYGWLHPRRRPAPKFRIDPYGSMADGVLRHLVESGTAEAVAALSGFGSVGPEKQIATQLAEARDSYRRKSWQPPAPADIRAVLDDPGRRLVRSEQDLANAVMASLVRAQQRISGETPAVTDLWDHPHDPQRREPKLENDLSDWLKRHLMEDLTEVLVNREVQITAGFKDVRKMREVDLHVTALAAGGDTAAPPRLLRVIVEDKGCWNAHVLTDIETQLAGTYLPQVQGHAGLYVVFRFDCITSGSQRRCTTCRDLTHEQLLSDLRQRAEQLSSEDRSLQTMVLDARLTQP
ncbi:hypothetical protein SAMN05660209_03307 [Geodermatophilus africanus]|uniref:Uncharacterized protein n=1 Tax=Geodermatophilus africanus TaxID=1137993 RepID=A0A1H3LFI4_9ACTN|nr:hypothetical protein [Geodermatophilus africanus]SDY62728.1 hypothetical protein SAMN05660209_03307 [Geodermatophilus africanus]